MVAVLRRVITIPSLYDDPVFISFVEASLELVYNLNIDKITTNVLI